MGALGESITIATESEKSKVKMIEKHTQSQFRLLDSAGLPLLYLFLFLIKLLMAKYLFLVRTDGIHSMPKLAADATKTEDFDWTEDDSVIDYDEADSMSSGTLADVESLDDSDDDDAYE